MIVFVRDCIHGGLIISLLMKHLNYRCAAPYFSLALSTHQTFWKFKGKNKMEFTRTLIAYFAMSGLLYCYRTSPWQCILLFWAWLVFNFFITTYTTTNMSFISIRSSVKEWGVNWDTFLHKGGSKGVTYSYQSNSRVPSLGRFQWVWIYRMPIWNPLNCHRGSRRTVDSPLYAPLDIVC